MYSRHEVETPCQADLRLNTLDQTTRAKLRSTQILTALPQIISELIQNSIDAKARHINIGLNCEEWLCWVSDDGEGINKQDLETFAVDDDAARYHTSKEYALKSLNALSTYGFRGEALASVAQVSCLEIASRTSKSRTTWSIIVKGGQPLYKGEAVRWRRESPGTVVCVRDAFFNLPVRRLSHPNVARTWEQVRQDIEKYALITPSVSFALEDLHRSQESGSKDRMVRIPKTSSTLSTFQHLFGRALVERVEQICCVYDDLKLNGFISLYGASSKAYQFLYINSHPITTCDLHRIIDAQFASSTFGKRAFDYNGENNIRTNSRRSPRKTEKKPIYVLNILVPPDTVDNIMDPAKTVVELQNKSSVIAFLTNIVRDFLSKHGFQMLQHNGESSSLKTSAMLHKRRKTDPEHPADDALPGITLPNCSRQYSLLPKSSARQETPLQSDNNGWPNFAHNYNSSDSVSFAHRNQLYHADARRTVNAPQSKVNPTLMRSAPAWLRNALQANDSFFPVEPKIPSFFSSLAPNPPSARFESNNMAQQTASSLESILATQSLMSHSFTRTDLSNARIISQVDRKFIACLIVRPRSHGHRTQGSSDSEQQSKMSESSTLVLIDQHAADERVRVENFLKELCLGFLHNSSNEKADGQGIKVQNLRPPKPILVTWHEMTLMKQSAQVREAFRSWGFHFTRDSTPETEVENYASNGDNNGHGQILVEAIPEIVSDKLLQGDELQDLVKGFLAQLQTDLISFSRMNLNDNDTEEFLWLKALRWCPRALLDLINSKACRGAIMFNDTLSIDQCQTLIQKLSLTAYPFQCAHGRPSLVPIIELEPQSGSPRRRRTLGCDWSLLEHRGLR